MPVAIDPNDLNDFIKPGQVCVKPPQPKPENSGLVEAEDVDQLPAAVVSLQDCLACAGCVTSSEAALVEIQSFKELQTKLFNPQKVYCVSISPQTRASLAAAFDLSIPEVDLRLEYLFNKLGFSMIIGTQMGRDLSIQESIKEVKERKDQGLVTISSVCPGITTYITKTHPKIVPMLSEVKSPQQITGHILKSQILKTHQVLPENVFHLAIMPCFDKKLESVNPDFQINGANEVDLVLTPKEIVDFVQTEWNTDFRALGSSPSIDNQDTNQESKTLVVSKPISIEQFNTFGSNSGSSSGGYLHHILQSYNLPVSTRVVSQDYIEYEVDGFKAAAISGFKNIQNLVRKLQPKTRRGKKVHYDYVELMACPSGCINGGGQLVKNGKEGITLANSKYDEIQQTEVGQLEPEIAENSLRTHYKAVEQEQDGFVLGTTW